MRDRLSDVGLSDICEMKRGLKRGLAVFWLKACDLFVYLNLHFRSYQFEEVTSTFVANIHQVDV